MNTKAFLSRIFAQRDEVVVSTWKPDPSGQRPRGFFWNRGSFANLDDAVNAIAQWDAEPDTTVYFTVGSMANHHYLSEAGKPRWHRRQQDATWFKTLALDLDIGPDKPYASQRDGWIALKTALEQFGFPLPMAISSGNGIHCYWPLTAPITAAVWTKISTALRMALQDHNVVIDFTKIHDSSMVLRPVGTHHKKQQPWKPVEMKRDCPDFDPVDLAVLLKPWANRVPKTKSGASAGKPQSAIMSAVLNSNDIDIQVVAQHCNQIKALVDTGGVLDAAGDPVQEPLWHASLPMAKHSKDPQQAIIWLAGQHPDFDMDANLDKMAAYKGSGPTTCARFEQLCAKGCEGCAYKGKITSPAQLSSSATTTVEDSTTGEVLEIKLPAPYVEKDGRIYKEITVTSETTDANGNTVTAETTEWDLVSPYMMHITGLYKDPQSGKSTFRLLIKYPMTGWQEEDHDIGVIATIGKEFSTFLLDRQVFGIKGPAQQEKLRGYLMDYLTLVQSQAPTGIDYVAFGWQEDGSFLCGENVINSPTGHTARRLRGAADRYGNIVKAHGSRDQWVEAMRMLNNPGTLTIRSAVLLALSGLLGRESGNGTLVVSIYSTETTTGKTLSLMAANSLIGTPRELFMTAQDTANALYKVRGVLNSLPCTVDELTTLPDEEMSEMAYYLSLGREKIAMTKNRDLREPVTWDGPTLITTNFSLHQKFENYQRNNEPLKVRVMELPQHDRTFVKPDATGISNGHIFFDLIAKNNGWAYPELVQAVVDHGGTETLYQKGVEAFAKKFNFIFEAQERFYRSGIINGWIIGKLGQKLGLLPFDIDETTQYLIDHVKSFRQQSAADRSDAFDIIGQFLQEHNDQIIEVIEQYGSGKEQVQLPAPEKAVARLKIVQDQNNPVMPGSQLAINQTLLKKWLGRSRDSLDRVAMELQSSNALISSRDRITIFKGCQNRNPGQAHCIIINVNHPRFADAIKSATAKLQSPVSLAVLQGGAS